VGNAAGLYLQVVAVAVGLGVILQESELAFGVLKLAGAAYLFFLGVRTIRERKALRRVLDQPVARYGQGTILRQGFVVGLTNPKTTVFFAAILPQFVVPSAGNVQLQMLVLGLVFVVIALVSDSAWGLAAGRARSWFERSPRRLEAAGTAGGVVMMGLATRLAFTSRTD
jgi:threonine/homoserine/homoserine lactone efflux protein